MRRILALAVFLAAALPGGAIPVSAAAATPYCGVTWGSLDKSAGSLSPGLLTNMRTGQHDCWDRVVFDFNNTATGYSVKYAPEVYSQGAGVRLGIAGGAKLNVTLLQHGESYPHATTDHVGTVNGYRTLRDVVYGGTHEGYTTFGVGIRARLPFRVFTLTGPNRIVLDVAHQWSQ